MIKREENLSLLIARYLKIKKYVYRFDVGADLKLTIGQARKNKAKQMPERGFPDLMVFKNSKTIFFELKKSKGEIYKKNGKIREGKHIQEQVRFHEKLRKEGFDVYFIWNLKMLIKILEG